MSLPTITDTVHGSRVGDVEFIWAKNSQEFLFSNSIYIRGEQGVIVDPSASFTYIAELASARAVQIVLNTHYHADHRSLNHLFSDVIFASPEADAKAISDFEEYCKIAVDDPQSFYLTWIRDVYKKYKIIDCPVALKLKDGDTLNTGLEKIRIIHIPGHTPGHSALYFENIDTLYTSDIDLTPYGPWYANPVSDIELFKTSIARVRDIQCAAYVTSHGERIYDREKFLERLDRYNEHFAARDEKILEALREKPMEIDELCSRGIVYRKASLVDPLKCFFQLQMVRKHLVILKQQGLIKDNSGLWSIA